MGLCKVAFPASLLQANMVVTLQSSKEAYIQCIYKSVSRCLPYLNHAIQHFPLSTQQQSQEVMENRWNNGILPDIAIPQRHEDGLQRIFSIIRDQQKLEEFHNSLPPFYRPIFADTSAAPSWLHVRPTHPHMEIPDREFTILARARLLKIGPKKVQHCSFCHTKDVPGNHPYSCRAFSQWRLDRHNFQVNTLHSYLPFETKKEQILFIPSSSSSESSSSSTRPKLIADLLIPSSRIAFDVTVVSTRPIHNSHAEAERRADNHKTNKYARALIDGSIRELIPVVLGPFGNVGTSARQYIDANLPDFSRSLKTRLALGAARGTARMIECWSRWIQAAQLGS